MALDLTLGTTNTSAATRTNTTITKPASVADGDFLMAYLYVEDDVAVTLPSGWAQVATVDHPGQPMDVYVYWKVASGEGASWTWNHASAWSQGGAYRVTGAPSSSPLDGTATTNTGTGTTATFTGLTTAQNNSALIGVGAHWASLTTYSAWGSPLTERLDTAEQSAFASGIQVTAGASGNKTATLSVSTDWMAIMFGLKDDAESAAPYVRRPDFIFTHTRR